MNRGKLYSPIRYSMAYLLTTYGLFIASDLSSDVSNVGQLSVFILSAYLLLYLGYFFGIRTSPTRAISIQNATPLNLHKAKIVILGGSIYMLIWGVNQTLDFGAQSISQVWETISNPGTAYSAKFAIYEKRAAELQVNRITQILVLTGVIFSLSLPTLLAFWKYIDLTTKVLATTGILIYTISFLYIGTQKGLGDLLLLSATGWAVSWGRKTQTQTTIDRLSSILYWGAIAFAALTYMTLNQASRANEFGISTTLMAEDVTNTWVAAIFGDQVALGFYLLIGYPSHGYLGLAHNLQQDFVFSYGAGLSQAFESYRLQYLGGSDNLLLTYPYRTEAATGWPAGMYWATAFPWFASDLTFLGVLPFMFMMGVLYARTWVACLSRMDIISLGILGQVVIFVAFLPANNQVLMSRQGLWSVLALGAMVLLRKVSKAGQNHAPTN